MLHHPRLVDLHHFGSTLLPDAPPTVSQNLMAIPPCASRVSDSHRHVYLTRQRMSCAARVFSNSSYPIWFHYLVRPGLSKYNMVNSPKATPLDAFMPVKDPMMPVRSSAIKTQWRRLYWRSGLSSAGAFISRPCPSTTVFAIDVLQQVL
jgi:hypothetical protein